MVFIEEGSVRFSIPEPAKASNSILVIPSARETVFNALQSSKPIDGIEETEEGIETEASAEQSAKIACPILLTPEGMETLVSCLHPLKALNSNTRDFFGL